MLNLLNEKYCLSRELGLSVLRTQGEGSNRRLLLELRGIPLHLRPVHVACCVEFQSSIIHELLGHRQSTFFFLILDDYPPAR